MTGTLVALAGAAGSGKSSLAKERWLPAHVFARDWARATAGAAPDDVSPGVLEDADDLLELIAGMRLSRGALTVVDSTGTAEGFLQRMLQVGRAHGARCELVIVDTPLQLCVARNFRRSPARQVPEPDIERQHAAVTELIARHVAGPAPWDHVEVVSGAPAPTGGVVPGTSLTRCKHCRAESFWAYFATTLDQSTKAGEKAKASLVEAAPRDDGDLVLVRWSGKTAVVRRLAPDEIARGVDESRYRLHLPYCSGRTAGGAR
jgi:predicted kinase